jgi:hypothetical protein
MLSSRAVRAVRAGQTPVYFNTIPKNSATSWLG